MSKFNVSIFQNLSRQCFETDLLPHPHYLSMVVVVGAVPVSPDSVNVLT